MHSLPLCPPSVHATAPTGSYSAQGRGRARPASRMDFIVHPYPPGLLLHMAARLLYRAVGPPERAQLASGGSHKQSRFSTEYKLSVCLPQLDWSPQGQVCQASSAPQPPASGPALGFLVSFKRLGEVMRLSREQGPALRPPPPAHPHARGGKGAARSPLVPIKTSQRPSRAGRGKADQPSALKKAFCQRI